MKGNADADRIVTLANQLYQNELSCGVALFFVYALSNAQSSEQLLN
jgi:hypothetical protein